MEPFYFIYTTLPDNTAAQQLARDLIKGHFAACVNILGNLQAVYEDEGRVCEEHEVPLLIKTTTQKREVALAFIKEHHPYHMPAILSWEALCNAPFGRWMQNQLHEDVCRT